MSNTGNDSVVQLDEFGDFKRVLYSINAEAAVTMVGLAWKSDTEELLIAYDSTTNTMDKVIAIKASSGVARTLISNVSLGGVITGLAQLTTGDIVIVEGAAAEKFSTDGVRIGAPFMAALQTTPQQMSPAAGGQFVVCSSGSDVVRVYNSSGVQLETVASLIAATSDSYGCMALASGGVAASFSGTTDTVRFYSSLSLSTATTVDYTDTNKLADPRGIAERANGNVLVLDNTFGHIVELTTTGIFVDLLGQGLLSNPQQILVIP